MRMTVFRRATERDVFCGCAVGHRNTLAKAGVVKPLARGEIVRMAGCGAGERSARGKRTQAVLRTEGIEIESDRGRREKRANNACADQNGVASHH